MGTITNKKGQFINLCINNGLGHPKDYIVKEYNAFKSCDQIAQELQDKYNIKITARHLAEIVKKNGVIRTKQEAKRLAIKTGRMVYVKTGRHYIQKGMGAKRRAEVFARDGYKCVMCGILAKDSGGLEIHHINGPDNNINNLQLLCKLCHEGIHAIKNSAS